MRVLVLLKLCSLISLSLFMHNSLCKVVVEQGEKFFYLDDDTRMSLKVVNHSLVVGIQKDDVGAVILGFGKEHRE
jgi:hypothetical protein